MKQIGIIGSSSENLSLDDKDVLAKAELLGRMIARRGAILFTGGTDGVMEAASKGAFEEKGITVGTPGRKRGCSNKYITVEVCTPIDIGDFLFAGTLSCDAIIVLPGDAGTVAELMIAYRNDIMIATLEEFVERIPGLDIIKKNLLITKTPEECINMIFDNI